MALKKIFTFKLKQATFHYHYNYISVYAKHMLEGLPASVQGFLTQCSVC